MMWNDMYPLHFCHFCESPLVAAQSDGFYYCDCENSYSSLYSGPGKFNVNFKCGNFMFHISEFETMITDVTPGKPGKTRYDVARIDVPMLVNNDNYLSVVEKVKKLQAFK